MVDSSDTNTMKKYKFKGEPFRHYHTYPVEGEAYDKEGTKRTITTFESRALKAGDVVEMEEGRFKSANLADRFEPVESENKGGAEKPREKPEEKKPEKVNTPVETEWTAVLSQGVQDVRGVIAALDSLDDLTALQAEEQKGSNRKMVLDAIEKRKGELSNK